MDTATSFGPQLRALREAAHMTRAELAEAAGLSRSMIHRLETGSRGTHTPLPTLQALATALGCAVATLIGE